MASRHLFGKADADLFQISTRGFKKRFWIEISARDFGKKFSEKIRRKS